MNDHHIHDAGEFIGDGQPAMSDMELLELAAKAARVTVTVVGDCLYLTQGDYLARKWNPLEDDGDAIRLAVRLGMIVSIIDRRAIVRAAAEIGKSLP